MLRRFMFKLLSIFCILVLVCFGQGNGITVANQSSDCGGGKCSYLPLVANPTPIVAVRSVLHVTSQYLSAQIEGEVKNVSDLPISNMVLRTKIYRNNVFVLERQQSPLISATLPGQANFYYVYGLSVDPPPNNTIITSETELVTATVDTSVPFRNLTVERIATGVISSFVGNAVTVTLKNNHPQTIHNVQIHVWALELNRDYFCNLSVCYSSRFVAAVAPGETYTATMDWIVGVDRVDIPASVISVVAQGIISP